MRKLCTTVATAALVALPLAAAVVAGSSADRPSNGEIEIVSHVTTLGEIEIVSLPVD